MDDNENPATLPLPAPAPGPSRPAATQPDKMNKLGPVEVNNDGTLSRVEGWSKMADYERERTLRVLSARNKLRMGDERKKFRDRRASEASATGSGSGLREPPVPILEASEYWTPLCFHLKEEP
ncbi:hypothetical protein GALMADRAFT_250778 [Galerina marginata CBS 339.88]|uniref:Uncharacterized protein n=1 Tax=Galerina marginata (strain CBS 339.88) TaxID=685588 RepID=A0A067ST46_GALM3|nr:hypothetical protein GALMADRAFT_250778 [Galerina marginata CBS 339.88]